MERSDDPSRELRMVREMVRELEQLEFHHSPAGTYEWDHYQKVLDLERRLTYAEAKRAVYPISLKAQNRMGRPDERSGDGDSRGRERPGGPSVGLESGQPEGADGREAVGEADGAGDDGRAGR